jgi:DNA-binding CsgD family transcriptional regulator
MVVKLMVERHPPITDRQREVISLIAAGLSNEEVAARILNRSNVLQHTVTGAWH